MTVGVEQSVPRVNDNATVLDIKVRATDRQFVSSAVRDERTIIWHLCPVGTIGNLWQVSDCILHSDGAERGAHGLGNRSVLHAAGQLDGELWRTEDVHELWPVWQHLSRRRPVDEGALPRL